MNRNFTIDHNLCKACGLCIKECIRHVAIPHQNHLDPQNPSCSRCYHCLAVCPNNAIKTRDNEPVTDFGEGLDSRVKEIELKMLFSLRRSHRQFTKETVSDETIKKID